MTDKENKAYWEGYKSYVRFAENPYEKSSVEGKAWEKGSHEAWLENLQMYG